MTIIQQGYYLDVWTVRDQQGRKHFVGSRRECELYVDYMSRR